MANIYLNKENEAKLRELLQFEEVELNATNIIDRVEEILNSVPVVGEAAEELVKRPVAIYNQKQIDTFKSLITSYLKGQREFTVKYPDTDISKSVTFEGAIAFFNFNDLYDRYNNGEKLWTEA